MTSKTDRLDTLPTEAREGAIKARRILVVTGESDDDYARTRAAASDIAAATGAEVILYDHSAGESLLDEQKVEALGRAYLADQIREARSRGVEAKAWLPLQTGRQGISEGVSRFDADLVIVPETLAKDSDVGVPVLVVGPDGAIGLAEADGKPADAQAKR